MRSVPIYRGPVGSPHYGKLKFLPKTETVRSYTGGLNEQKFSCPKTLIINSFVPKSAQVQPEAQRCNGTAPVTHGELYSLVWLQSLLIGCGPHRG